MSNKSRNAQWMELWIEEFDEQTKAYLKNAHNPHEFVSILAALLKEKDAHLSYLQNLAHETIRIVEEICSEDAKSRYKLLFAVDSVEERESSKALFLRWKRFRESKIHLGFLRKVAHLMANLLREKKHKKALEIATELDKVPSYLVNARHMNGIQEMLNPSSGGRVRCLVIFGLEGLRVFGVCDETEVQGVTQKAIEIFQRKCFEVFSHHVLLASHRNGFAFVFEDVMPKELARQTSLLVHDFALQKFSFQNNLFSCEFKVEIIEDEHMVSFEELRAIFSQKLEGDVQSKIIKIAAV